MEGGNPSGSWTVNDVYCIQNQCANQAGDNSKELTGIYCYSQGPDPCTLILHFHQE